MSDSTPPRCLTPWRADDILRLQAMLDSLRASSNELDSVNVRDKLFPVFNEEARKELKISRQILMVLRGHLIVEITKAWKSRFEP